MRYWHQLNTGFIWGDDGGPSLAVRGGLSSAMPEGKPDRDSDDSEFTNSSQVQEGEIY